MSMSDFGVLKQRDPTQGSNGLFLPRASHRRTFLRRSRPVLGTLLRQLAAEGLGNMLAEDAERVCRQRLAALLCLATDPLVCPQIQLVEKRLGDTERADK
jgi:hypothetical protein